MQTSVQVFLGLLVSFSYIVPLKIQFASLKIVIRNVPRVLLVICF